ncbi:MAG: hypothetical protein AVDCRST_MAG64-522 [uncultured Phycisphaerae bacterium]|uniref:Uncharacterized protein n=1 Tax=uncultured Phycisphaerae bacterium TaxID=904963 RepID=A0A6J4NA99_9BACT|nr:MAG: hypothetical protein AVDCRST_MAG64-522 [uncultured Phycisphaerae bacterium]
MPGVVFAMGKRGRLEYIRRGWSAGTCRPRIVSSDPVQTGRISP